MASTWARMFLVALVVLSLTGPPTPRPADARTASQQTVDLATYPARRWIVQLADPPLAQYRGTLAGLPATTAQLIGHRLKVVSALSTSYLARLSTQRERLTATLGRVARGARVERTYEVALNGMAVAMSPEQAAVVRALPGVKAVTPDIPFRLSMFSTPQQSGAPAVWEQLGGQPHAGEGVKVAIIDSGIYVTRNADGSYAGNPCFDDTGYTAPPGFPKGDRRFTNNKVIVARTYFRPGEPPTQGNETAIQGPGASPHGTHTAGTVACNAGTKVAYEGATVTLSGIAPRAYLMNYRVFYPTTAGDEFGNGNAYLAELIDAIDDAVRDGADVISNSWGASYQNTLAWPDPMIKAAEAAVDAGTVVVFANGNAGPATATAGSPALSPKVISVGAVTKDTTIATGVIDVSAPPPVPAKLQAVDADAALFGPQVSGTFGPAPYVPVEKEATDHSPLGCPLDGDASPYPQGALTGKVALISRGTCEFSVKVFHAQQAGAVAVALYNSKAGGENLQSITGGAHAGEIMVPSWFVRRSEGLALRDFAAAHLGKAMARFTYGPHPAANGGDVLSDFSSRGPTQDQRLKPDVVAPGTDILSAGYGQGEYPAPFTGFGTASGTSMATPHVAGAAALLRQLHPDWTPAQVKSALMSTASEQVFLDPARTQPAEVLDRGAGRIDLAKAAKPGLTFDQPSLSAGDLPAGEAATFTIHARNIDNAAGTWKITTAQASGLKLSVTSRSITVSRHGDADIKVRAASTASAKPDDYQGSVVLTNTATKTRLHIPVWLRVTSTKTAKDVLLIDLDGSSANPRLADYAKTYKDALSAAGVSYTYLDPGPAPDPEPTPEPVPDAKPFPSLAKLSRYRVALLFTGDNDSAAASGLTQADQDRLAEWLDSGGRLWATGQNLAEVTDTNPNSSTRLGRSRLYHGYLGLAYEAATVYAGPAPSPTAQGLGPMDGLELDLAPGKDGAGNQSSVEATSPMPDTDTFAATDMTIPLFRQIGGSAPGSAAIAFARSGEPSLDEERVPFRYRSVAMGFGLEGVDTTATANRADLAKRTLDWLLDEVTVTAQPTAVRSHGQATLAVKARSSADAALTRFRWDFGDGTPPVTTDQPLTQHRYDNPGRYTARVEVTDSLGHRAVATRTVSIR
ncbi:MAG: S8 family serine peptidase [Egibacteraceae bacterium]